MNLHKININIFDTFPYFLNTYNSININRFGNGCGNGYGFLPALLYINSKGNGKTNIIYIDENGNK